MNRILLLIVSCFAASFLYGCAVPEPPKWNDQASTAGEYNKYLVEGKSSISGQAFFALTNGGVVKGAGSQVTLDPATTTGREYWEKAGRSWTFRTLAHPSPEFGKARKITIADADGRFSFKNIPAGIYYVRTAVTWYTGTFDIHGGIVGKLVEVREAQNTEVILNEYAI